MEKQWKREELQNPYLDLYVCLSKQEASAVLREMRSCWSTDNEGEIGSMIN